MSIIQSQKKNPLNNDKRTPLSEDSVADAEENDHISPNQTWPRKDNQSPIIESLTKDDFSPSNDEARATTPIIRNNSQPPLTFSKTDLDPLNNINNYPLNLISSPAKKTLNHSSNDNPRNSPLTADSLSTHTQPNDKRPNSEKIKPRSHSWPPSPTAISNSFWPLIRNRPKFSSSSSTSISEPTYPPGFEDQIPPSLKAQHAKKRARKLKKKIIKRAQSTTKYQSQPNPPEPTLSQNGSTQCISTKEVIDLGMQLGLNFNGPLSVLHSKIGEILERQQKDWANIH